MIDELTILRGLVEAARRVLGEPESMRWARRVPARDGQGYDLVEVDPYHACWVVWYGWVANPTTSRPRIDRGPDRYETREAAIEAAIAWLDGRTGDE